MKLALGEIRHKIDALQEKRYSQYADKNGVAKNMPKDEKDLQMELILLQRKIEHLRLNKC